MQGRWLRVIPAIAGVAVLAAVLWLIVPPVLQRVALDGDWRLAALERVTTVRRDGEKLVLSGAGVELRFVPGGS